MFEHGVPFRLSDRVQRIVAPNPGVMTGPGTNTYLIGDQEVAVLDPGPDIEAHVDAILSAAGDRIKWVIATHTHRDHSPAWHAVAQATGAQVIGALPWDDTLQDNTFKPDTELLHGEVLNASGFTLRAIHTPGHVGNHFCFMLEEEGLVFAGDHIMNGSTVVIVPPSGNMKAYIDSLQLLLDYPIKAIAPGHGELIDQPVQAIEWLIAHRLKRESKVLAGLTQLGSGTLGQLVTVVYDDVDKKLHKMAGLSLTAHLIKLQQEGRVVHHDESDSWECA